MEKAKQLIDMTCTLDDELILKKHVGLIHSENKLTLIQRKICNILLFNALNKIQDQDVFEISIKQLCSLIGYSSNDTHLIKQSIKSLISVVMEWNLLEDNKFLQQEGLPEEEIIWNASALLAGATIRRGRLSYSYSPQIKSILTSLEIYGRINLFVQAKFNSTYSLVLYENCVRFKTIKQTNWFTVELLRTLLGVEKNKYPNFKEFNRNVLNVAINEINKKSDIYLQVQYRRAGRKVDAIKFTLTENENYQPTFKRHNEKRQQVTSNQTDNALLNSLRQEFGFSLTQVKEMLLAYRHDYIVAKIKFVHTQANIKNKRAYLISALKNDYQAPASHPTAAIAAAPSQYDNTYMRELKALLKIAFYAIATCNINCSIAYKK